MMSHCHGELNLSTPPPHHPQRHQAEVTDLISEGEIGSGTCGQVFKVRFKKTGHVIAVKVRDPPPPGGGND